MSETEDFIRGDMKEEFKKVMVSPEAVVNFSKAINEITKIGMKLPISWEALAGNPRKGHYVPVGVKWIQWVGWASGLALFKVWRALEKTLDKSRHFSGVSGYEWEDAEYQEFSQRRKWVEDEG